MELSEESIAQFEARIGERIKSQVPDLFVEAMVSMNWNRYTVRTGGGTAVVKYSDGQYLDEHGAMSPETQTWKPRVSVFVGSKGLKLRSAHHSALLFLVRVRKALNGYEVALEGESMRLSMSGDRFAGEDTSHRFWYELTFASKAKIGE